MKRPKVKPFQGISKDVEKDIEEAVSKALSSEKNNPTSDYNTKKGRNNTSRYGPKDREKRTGSGLKRLATAVSDSAKQIGTFVPGIPNAGGMIAKALDKKPKKFSGGGRAGDVRDNSSRGKTF
jgi:hypothetical protein